MSHETLDDLRDTFYHRDFNSIAQLQISETLVGFFGFSENELLAECFLKGTVYGTEFFLVFYVNFCGIAKR